MTYKTAWRMCNLIRKYMGWVDGDAMIGGPGKFVEADKTFIGGVDKQGEDDKAIVLGMVERKGEVITRVLDDAALRTCLAAACREDCEGQHVFTDEAKVFRRSAPTTRTRRSITPQDEYVRGNVHTNTVEGFWAR